MEIPEIKQKLSEPDSSESLLKATLLSVDLTREQLMQTVKYLAGQGWTRRTFYDVCLYVNLNEPLLANEHDMIGNFIDALTGFLNQDNIIRLPGDSEDKEAFLKHIYSGQWKN